MVHEAVAGQDGSAPLNDAVAVSDRLSASDALTVIFDVPWPLMIFPAVMDHVIVVLVSGSPPVTFASNVIGLSASSSLGQLTVRAGHAGGSGSHCAPVETVTEVEELAVCWCPSLTSTVAV